MFFHTFLHSPYFWYINVRIFNILLQVYKFYKNKSNPAYSPSYLFLKLRAKALYFVDISASAHVFTDELMEQIRDGYHHPEEHRQLYIEQDIIRHAIDQ